MTQTPGEAYAENNYGDDVPNLGRLAAESDQENHRAIQALRAALGPEAERRAAIAATVGHFFRAGVSPSAASAILAIFGVTRAELAQAQSDLKDARENGF